jgi:hypothetical protein
MWKHLPCGQVPQISDKKVLVPQYSSDNLLSNTVPKSAQLMVFLDFTAVKRFQQASLAS